jgi:hypothetical protein
VPYALLIALFEPFGTPQRPAFSPQAMAQQNQSQLPPAVAYNPTAAVLGMIGTAVFMIVLMPLCSAAMIHNISASYLGETLTAGQSYARAAPRLLGLVGTQFLVMLAIAVGYLLCIVPGIIFSLWFLVVAPVVILERVAGPTAMRRSRELMRGNLDKGFILALVVGILTFVIVWALQFLTTLVPLPHPAIGAFINTLLQAILLPIQTAPWILLYYDLRIRKEAFDLQKLAEALGQPAAT